MRGQLEETALSAMPLDALLEHIARRLKIDQGERKLTLVYSGGALRRSFVELGPLRPDELNELAN